MTLHYITLLHIGVHLSAKTQNVAKRYLTEAPVDSFAPKPNVDMFDGFSFAVDADTEVPEVTEVVAGAGKESSESNESHPGTMDGFHFTDTGYLSTEDRSSVSAMREHRN